MFIQTERTPNPDTLKFIPGETIMPSGTADFGSGAEAGASQLAQRLFKIEGVTRVFLGPDFISVTKDAGEEWDFLKARILAAIMEHLSIGMPIIDPDYAVSKKSSAGASDLDNAIIAQIEELLETRVRPAVQSDGGDIVFDRFEDGVVFLRMRGACAGCPSSTATLKVGIENMLRHYVPEVLEVRQADDL
ncbi:NifU family protein [Micavibrio aeruginosavorus]|uniref:NifU-like domain protein n=1 Tax=Micavibrio aeruginosavorus EPB TaxID=349215 RepID=M4VWX9_9BACT|nr:NifU family protein [Micavibrio aeruginosavorus]AGH97709.1 NifU-like domain protein [Micavibrio aeruginosavorus EPB]